MALAVGVSCRRVDSMGEATRRRRRDAAASRPVPLRSGRSGADRYRNLRATGYLHHAQRICDGHIQRNVARDRSDAFNLQLRRAHGQQQRESIVHARVGIDYHAEGAAIGSLIGPALGRCLDGLGMGRQPGR